MAYEALVYGDLFINSSELISVRFSRNMSINEINTFNYQTLTTPGNCSPLKITAKVKIRLEASDRFQEWSLAIAVLNFKTLYVLTRPYTECYLTNVDIEIADMDEDGNVLFFDMDLEFVQNLNFS